jgi:2-amino-4-hydroxy-6-hydroxymethyldihydropteridine diphosphokinase
MTLAGTSPHGRDEATPFILSLGSNLGDRRANLMDGAQYLSHHVAIHAVSRIVESRPWGPVPEQPDFLNMVLRGSTSRDAFFLLEVAQSAESAAGRVRGIRRGPRTLDVDLIFFGDLCYRSPRLQIPHPAWAERPFVYGLLPEVAGDMVDPQSGRPLRELPGSDSLPRSLREVAPVEAPTTGDADG